MSTFDMLLDYQELATQEGQKPFWTLDLNDESQDSELHKWLNQSFDALQSQGQARRQQQRQNLAAYRGINYRRQPASVGDQEARGVGRRVRNPRIVVNHMLDMVEQHVSRMTKFRPAVEAQPASDDHDDRMTAKVADELIEAFWYREDIDKLLEKLNRGKRILGEHFVFIEWNEHKGPLHPDWLKKTFEANGIKKDPRKLKPAEIKDILRNEVKEWPRVALNIKSDTGEPLYIDRPMRIGDVEYKVVMPWNVFMQRNPEGDFENVDWIIYREKLDVDDVKADYPKLADKIAINDGTRFFDAEKLEEVTSSRYVEVYTMYHRSTRWLDQGRRVKWTRDVILENGPNPYELDDQRILPCVRMMDIQVPGMLNGEGMVKHGRPLQHLYNNAFSMTARNQFLFAHPKWMVPKGSVSAESLANQQTLVQYQGATEPRLAQANPTGQETFAWMEKLKEDYQQLMGIFGQSRGEPPSGITAAVALSFLDEQETERANTSIAEHNRVIKEIARQTLAIMGCFYDESDERLGQLLGRTRASDLEFFRFSDLGNITDVRVNTASSLPRQKAARLQTLLDLSERYPEELDNRQVLDMLDLGQKDKYISVSTVAVRAAEKEQSTLETTGDIPAPEKWEDHLMHYKIHLACVNDPAFKVNTPKERQEKMRDHIAGHELIMMEMMQTNPMFMEAVLAQYPQFPSFYEGRDELAAMMAPPVPPEGAIPPEGMPAMPMPPVDMPMGQEVPAGLNEVDPMNEAPVVPPGPAI